MQPSPQLDESDILHVRGLSTRVEHPLGSVRISARLGNTVRSLWFPDGSKCESTDYAAVEVLERRRGGGRGGRFIHRLESSWRAALGAIAALALLIVVGTHWGIPFLARRIANAIPRALAYDLGHGTVEVLDRTLFKASELTEDRKAQLRAEFAGMAKYYPELPLTLTFRRGIGPNALALPDGTVIATDELVKMAKTDQQVLAVLAHEIGHVHHRHGLRTALESSTVLLLISAYLGDVTQLTNLSTALPAVYAQAHYSRDNEIEADTFAMKYLDQAGIPRREFANILWTLQQEVGPDPEHGFQYLASHPPTTERIRRFRQ